MAINSHYGQSETQSVDSMLQDFTETQIEQTEVDLNQDLDDLDARS